MDTYTSNKSKSERFKTIEPDRTMAAQKDSELGN